MTGDCWHRLAGAENGGGFKASVAYRHSRGALAADKFDKLLLRTVSTNANE